MNMQRKALALCLTATSATAKKHPRHEDTQQQQLAVQIVKSLVKTLHKRLNVD